MVLKKKKQNRVLELAPQVGKEPHNASTPRTDDLYDLFPLYYLDLSRKISSRSCMILLIFVKWGVVPPYDLHDLAHVSWVFDLYSTDPAQPLTTAREELQATVDDLYIMICPIGATAIVERVSGHSQRLVRHLGRKNISDLTGQ